MRAGPALLLAALTGCTGSPAYCTEIGVDTRVRVDTSALALPAGTTGQICLDGECAVADLRDPFFPEGALGTGAYADVPTVQVSVTLVDAAGTELWSADAPVATHVVEPNGPGCGRWTVLPRLTATPDGRLTS